MAGFSNRGKARMVQVFVGDYALTGTDQFYCGLITDAATLDPGGFDYFSDLSQIVTGEGYLDGGIGVDRTTTQWTLTEDDGADVAYVRSADITFTNDAAGGTIPASAGGATHAALMSDEGRSVDGTITGREIYGWGDFGGAKTSGTDQDFVVQNLELRLTE